VKKQGKSSANNFSGDATFADVSLTQADKDAFSSWMDDASKDFELWLNQLIDDSYRITVKFDYNNNCYTSSATQQDQKHVNAGLIIMSRAGSPLEALLMAIYKIFVLFPGERLPTREETAGWG
jgi:hypothetical protein